MAKPKPVLRIAGGTLRVRLSADHGEDIMLDRELVASQCPTLAPRLRHPGETRYVSAWDNSKEIHKGGTNDTVRISTLALNPAERTFLLDGRDFVAPSEDSFYTFFFQSGLACPKWTTMIKSVYEDMSQANANSIHSHTILFRFLHGRSQRLRLDKKDAYPFSYGRGDFVWLVDVCALADFYGCLGAISDAIVDSLTKSNMFWQHVNREPLVILRLAVQLKSKDLYHDAWRHVMGQALSYANPQDSFYPLFQEEKLRQVANHLCSTSDELLEKLQKIRSEQNDTIASLKLRLRKLHLNPSYARRDGVDYKVDTSFLDIIRNSFLIRKQRDRKAHRARFLAGSIYAQWLTQQEMGHHIYGSHQPRSCSAGPFNVAVSKLEHFSTTRNPSDIFGRNAVEEILSELGLEYSTMKDVKAELKDIIIDAAAIIKETFVTRKFMDGDEFLTYRRAHWHGEYNSYFTYLPMDEGVFPWDDADNLEQFWEDAIEEAEDSRHGSEDERLRWEEWEDALMTEST